MPKNDLIIKLSWEDFLLRLMTNALGKEKANAEIKNMHTRGADWFKPAVFESPDHQKSLGLCFFLVSAILLEKVKATMCFKDTEGVFVEKTLEPSILLFYEEEIFRSCGHFFLKNVRHSVLIEAPQNTIWNLARNDRPFNQTDQQRILVQEQTRKYKKRLTSKKQFLENCVNVALPNLFSSELSEDQIFKTQKFTIFWSLCRPDDLNED